MNLSLGTFEFVHYGHIRFFKKCLQFGELSIGLNTDEFIEKYKGRKPIMSYQERMAAIKESFPQITVYPNSQDDGTIKDVLDHVKPELLIIGSDWLRKDYLKQIGLNPDDLDDRGISLMYVPYTWDISSSELRRRISEY